MSTMLIQSTTLEDIADAIRTKTGESDLMTPLEMPSAIDAIPSGGEDRLLYYNIKSIPTYTSQQNVDYVTDYTGSVNIMIAQTSQYNANTKIGILLNGTEVSYSYQSNLSTPYYFRERQNLSVTAGNTIRFRLPQTASVANNCIMIVTKNIS